MRWEDIDVSNQVIAIQRAHWRGAVSVPKNGKARQVPMCSTVKDELRGHHDRLTALRDPGLAAGWCFATVGKRGPNKGKVRLRAPSFNRRVQLRYEVTAELLDRSGIAHEYIDSEGQSLLSQMMSLVLIGDYASYYLAMLYRIDPSPVEVISYLKERLAEG